MKKAPLPSLDFPKPVMTVTELVDMGFGRTELNRYVHMHGCPCYKDGGRTSPWRFYTKEFSKWLNNRQMIS